MSRLKAAVTIAAVFLLAALVFGLGVIAYFKTGPGQHLILRRLNNAIPGTLVLDGLRFSILAGTLELQNPSLLSPSGENVLGCKRLYADVEWLALLNRTVSIAELLLESPWAELRLDASGGFNLIQTVQGPQGNSPKTARRPVSPTGFWNGKIKSLRMSNGNLRFVAEQAAAVFKVAAVDVNADADIQKKFGKLTLNSGTVEVNSPQSNTTFDYLKLALVYDHNQPGPLKIELATAFGSAAICGRVEQLAAIPSVDLTLDLMVDLVALQSAAGLPGDSSGRISLKGTVRGSLDSPRVRLHAAYGGGKIYGVQVASARMDVDMEDRRVRAENLAVQAASGLLEGAAEVNLAPAFPQGFLSPNRNPAAASCKLRLTENGMRLEQLGLSHFRGRIDVTAEMTGSIIKPRIQGAIRGTSLAFHDVNFGNMDLQADLDAAGILFVRQLVIQNQGSTVQGFGALSLFQPHKTTKPTPVFKVQLHRVDLQDFLPLLPLAGGVVTGQLQLEGSLQNPRATANLSTHSLVYNQYRLGDLSAVVRWDNGHLQLDPLVLHNQASEFKLHGSAQLMAPGTWTLLDDPRLNIQINAERLCIEDFWDHFKGQLLLTGRIRGSLNRPQGAIRISGKNLDFNLQKIQAAELNVRLADQTAHLDSLYIGLTAKDVITGSGWIAFDQRFGFQFASQGVNLTQIDRLHAYPMVAGTCAFDMTGGGRLSDPEIEANITVTQVRFNQNPLDDFRLRLTVHNRQARILGNLNLALDGVYDFRQNAFALEVTGQQTDLSPYFSLLGRNDLTGRLTGSVRLTGNTDSLAGTAGIADLSDVELFSHGVQVIRSSILKMTFEDQIIQIREMKLVLMQDGFLDLQGYGSLDGPLNFKANGKIPLEVLRPFVQDLSDLSGSLNLTANLGGTRTSPIAVVDIGLEQVSLTLPVLMQKLQNLNGRLSVTQHQIQIHTVNARLDTGQLDLAGNIDLVDFYPQAGTAVLRARALPVRIPEILEAVVDSDLKITGSAEHASIQGEVVLLDGLYYKNFKLNLLDTVGEKKRPQTGSPGFTTRPLLRHTTLDIALKARAPLRVENNLVRLTMRPDLSVRGILEAPVLSGRADIQSGNVLYSKRKFEITKGVVDFANPYRTEPVVDMEGRTRIRTWNIFLTLSGPPDQLVFRLRSDPVEEDNDILSLLLTGQTSRELIGDEGGETRSTEQMLAEMIAATFGDDVMRATGLDIFEISAADEVDASGEENVKLTLGKEISRRMTVKYEARPRGGEITQRAIAEYKIMENIVANGFQDLRGIFGGELQFRLEFW